MTVKWHTFLSLSVRHFVAQQAHKFIHEYKESGSAAPPNNKFFFQLVDGRFGGS